MQRRDSWKLKNISTRQISLGDLPRIPTIGPNRVFDLLDFYQKDELLESSALLSVINGGWCVLTKFEDNTVTVVNSDNATEALTVAFKDQISSDGGGGNLTGGMLTSPLDITNYGLQFNSGADTVTALNWDSGLSVFSLSDGGIPVVLGGPLDITTNDIIANGIPAIAWDGDDQVLRLGMMGCATVASAPLDMNGLGLNMRNAQISFSGGDGQTSYVQPGTFGSYLGVSLICTVGYELNWQNGVLNVGGPNNNSSGQIVLGGSMLADNGLVMNNGTASLLTNTTNSTLNIGDATNDGTWASHIRFTSSSNSSIDTRIAAADDGLLFRNFNSSGTVMFSFRDSSDTHFWDMYQGGRSVFGGGTDDGTTTLQVTGDASISGTLTIGTLNVSNGINGEIQQLTNTYADLKTRTGLAGEIGIPTDSSQTNTFFASVVGSAAFTFTITIGSTTTGTISSNGNLVTFASNINSALTTAGLTNTTATVTNTGGDVLVTLTTTGNAPDSFYQVSLGLLTASGGGSINGIATAGTINCLLVSTTANRIVVYDGSTVGGRDFIAPTQQPLTLELRTALIQAGILANSLPANSTTHNVNQDLDLGAGTFSCGQFSAGNYIAAGGIFSYDGYTGFTPTFSGMSSGTAQCLMTDQFGDVYFSASFNGSNSDTYGNSYTQWDGDWSEDGLTTYLSSQSNNIIGFNTGSVPQLAFFGKNPIPQGTAIADATSGTDVITQLNTLLAFLRSRGDIAS